MLSDRRVERYSRQIALKVLGLDGQKKIWDASVAVIGCRAIGSAAAELLARTGVGRLKVVDRDLVELSNLHRQLLYDERHAVEGLPKAVACAERLARDGRITHLVAGLGTSGTLMGAGRYLKERKPSVQLIAVEPEPGHRIQGLKNMSRAIVPKIYDESIIDRKIVVTTREAYEWAARLTREEGIFAGQSSGAAMCGAARVAQEIDEGVMVVIFPDLGFKYLTAEPYHDKEVVRKVLETRRTGRVIRV